ncbi:hypothetical protein [Paramuribaculum intestinale]|uniref:hypothetical protein n=1 Tax=Paramuribaculum intestinale TaxID=2094151 RepID=UPI0025B63AC5|nr:hypothetical protein [Paramuribaculum intestinale]
MTVDVDMAVGVGAGGHIMVNACRRRYVQSPPSVDHLEILYPRGKRQRVDILSDPHLLGGRGGWYIKGNAVSRADGADTALSVMRLSVSCGRR